MKIVCFEINVSDQDFFKQNLTGHEVSFVDGPLSEETVDKAQGAEAVVVFIYSSLTKEILDKLLNLRFIATMSTGYDHIDLEECKSRNILVSNVPSYGEVTVAEHTFALILAVSRRIIESYERVKSGYFSPDGLTGFDLNNKTIGVVGVGSIGKNVIKIAKGFGMNVLGYKRSPDPDLEKELGFKIVSLEELLSSSDIVTLHLPYSQETHHLMDEEKFTILKKGAVIINTARGAIIDTKALLSALEKGNLAGAGLDVCEGEPMLREEAQLLSKQFNSEQMMYVLEEHMLLAHKNVVITPHNAFNSREALRIIQSTTVENINNFSSNSPKNVIS